MQPTWPTEQAPGYLGLHREILPLGRWGGRLEEEEEEGKRKKEGRSRRQKGGGGGMKEEKRRKRRKREKRGGRGEEEEAQYGERLERLNACLHDSRFC